MGIRHRREGIGGAHGGREGVLVIIEGNARWGYSSHLRLKSGGLERV